MEEGADRLSRTHATCVVAWASSPCRWSPETLPRVERGPAMCMVSRRDASHRRCGSVRRGSLDRSPRGSVASAFPEPVPSSPRSLQRAERSRLPEPSAPTPEPAGDRDDEAYLPAEPHPPPARARLPGPHEDEGWPRRPGAPPRQGPQAARGQHPLQVAVTEGGDRFRRADRLRKPGEFRRVSRDGARRAGAHLIVLQTTVEGDGVMSPRIGLTVSRKVGNAVVRNRVKRRLREWFRRKRASIPSRTETVIIARASAAKASYADLAAELQRLVCAGGARG